MIRLTKITSNTDANKEMKLDSLNPEHNVALRKVEQVMNNFTTLEEMEKEVENIQEKKAEKARQRRKHQIYFYIGACNTWRGN